LGTNGYDRAVRRFREQYCQKGGKRKRESEKKATLAGLLQGSWGEETRGGEGVKRGGEAKGIFQVGFSITNDVYESTEIKTRIGGEKEGEERKIRKRYTVCQELRGKGEPLDVGGTLEEIQICPQLSCNLYGDSRAFQKTA